MKAKGIWGMMVAMAAGLFNGAKTERFNKDPQLGRHGKRKGGGKGKGSTIGRLRFAIPKPGEGGNWHRANRPAWRDKGPA